MDKLQAMTIFVKIADEGSLTAAANVLGKSLPSVVRILATLEETLQTRLLNRTTRKIALTEEGRIYLDRCRKILADVEESEMALNKEHSELRGTITLTAPIRFGVMYVAPSVTRFLSLYPDVQVNLLLLDRVVNLLDEGIDVAIRIAKLEDSSLIARPVGKIRQVVCASPELLSKQASAIDHPLQLSQQPCVRFSGVSPNSIWHFQEKGKRLSVEITGHFNCNQVKPLVDACVAGLGFGYFLDYQVRPSIENGELNIVLGEFELESLPLNLVFPHTRLMATRIRTMIDWLARDLKESFNGENPED
ncbi:LysR family transcriptional regulator [Gammaproteobacteria bacterium AH-315-K14]|nr:LysR family transcriptional regulator [Gammaproteobacteria bacterium AH-315-K14]